MRQFSFLLRSVADRAFNRRPVRPGVLAASLAAPRSPKPLHIATSVSIIAGHRHSAVSVVDAREAIQHLATTRWPTRSERQLIEDLVRATGLALNALAEL